MGSTGVHRDPALSSHLGHAKGTAEGDFGVWQIGGVSPRDRTLDPLGIVRSAPISAVERKRAQAAGGT